MNVEKLTKQILQMEVRQREQDERIAELERRLQERNKNITREMFSVEDVARMSGLSVRRVKSDKGKKIKTKFPRAKRCFTLDQVQDYLRGV